MKITCLVLLTLAFLFSCSHQKQEYTGEDLTSLEEANTPYAPGRGPASANPKLHSKSISSPNNNIAETKEELTCSLHKDKRYILNASLDNGGCAVNYEKYGESAQVANARNDIGHCDKVFNKIRNNLENAGFNCL